MRVVISTRHTELSGSVKEYAQEKIGRLERFGEEFSRAELVLSAESHYPRDSGGPDDRVAEDPENVPVGERLRSSDEVTGDVATAELVVRVAREHKPFVARSKGGSFTAAIDVVVDKMERQLRKYKEKFKRRHRQPGRPAD